MNFSFTNPLRLAKTHDLEFFGRELDSFLPDKISDAHCHVWHHDHAAKQKGIPDVIGHREYVEAMKDIHDERHMKIEPHLVGLEHLRSLKWACWSKRLTDAQIEDIFFNNAARLWGLNH